jgi:thiol-disulfide isomerase/thioredoxin
MLSCQTDLSSRERRDAGGEDTNSIPIEIQSEWPKPTSYAGQIPLYEKFSDLEPLFRLNNDTTYVINFWATWCKPCIEELPYLEQINEKYKDTKVRVILCSLDFPDKIESRLIPFVEKKKLRSKVVVLLDGKFNDWIDKVSEEWSGAIPVTYIYRGDQVQFINESFESYDDLESAIKPMM